jgi:hypothetical protein
VAITPVIVLDTPGGSSDSLKSALRLINTTLNTLDAALAAKANSSSIPTNLSSLTNDMGFITSASAPVSSVAGRTGAILLSSADLSDVATTNSANSLVKRDVSGNFSAGVITATLNGNASAATKLITARTINGVAFDGSANISFTTDGVSEGTTNVYFTASRARAAISAGGSLTYNAGTGVISYLAPTLATVATSGAYADLTGRPALGTAAAANIGTTIGTVAPGDDSRIVGAVQKSNNLSDLTNVSTARTNLGLGNAATQNVGTTAGTVAAGNDSRIVNAAQKGANADITSLTGLTTPLSVAQGGTGATSFGGASVTETGAGSAKTLADALAAKADKTQLATSAAQRFSVADGNATAGQTSFTVSAYTPGTVLVYWNGLKLPTDLFTASDGSHVVLTDAIQSTDVIEVLSWLVAGVQNAAPLSHQHQVSDITGLQQLLTLPSRARFSVADGNMTAGQNTFTIPGGYTAGCILMFYNGQIVAASDYTATNGTTVVLSFNVIASDVVDFVVQRAGGIANAAPVSHQHEVTDILHLGNGSITATGGATAKSLSTWMTAIDPAATGFAALFQTAFLAWFVTLPVYSGTGPAPVAAGQPFNNNGTIQIAQ